MKKLLAVTALTLVAASAQAAVINVAGSLDYTLNGMASVSYNPAAPALAGTFDTVTGALNWTVQDHTMSILIAPGFDANIVLTNINMVGNGSSLAGGSATVVSCTGGAAGMICPSVGTPPTSNTYTWTWNGTNGTLTQLINGGVTQSGGNTSGYSFQAVQAVPVPAAAWLFGSALVGLAGIGRKRA
jgi:hypothetical protein